MKIHGRNILLALVVAGLVFGLSNSLVTAQDSAAPAGEYKIRIVDMQLLLTEYKLRQQKYDALQKEVDALQIDIDNLSKSIEAQKKAYEDTAANLSDDERFAKRQKIEEDFAEYKSELNKRQAQIDLKEEQVLKEVLRNIDAAIGKVAEQEKCHLILNASDTQKGTVLYYSPTINITSKVLTLLNQ